MDAAPANVISFASAKATAAKKAAAGFVKQPVSTNNNLYQWAAVLGAFIVLSIMWKMILFHILEGVENA